MFALACLCNAGVAVCLCMFWAWLSVCVFAGVVKFAFALLCMGCMEHDKQQTQWAINKVRQGEPLTMFCRHVICPME
jgi:hypothetical protein